MLDDVGGEESGDVDVHIDIDVRGSTEAAADTEGLECVCVMVVMAVIEAVGGT